MNKYTGEQIRAARLHIGATQPDLARELGCSPAYVCFVERGRYRVPDWWQDRLAEILPAGESFPQPEESRRRTDIQGLCHALGLSQREMAAAVGVSQQIISRVLNGKVNLTPWLRDRINALYGDRLENTVFGRLK